MNRGILYYSDNQLNMKMSLFCRQYISNSKLPITSVTLKPTKFGKNISLPLERCYKSMYKQILVGLETMTEDIIYFCEHDTLYHPSHFKFIPPEKDVFYYNGNYWFLRMTDGFAIHYDVSPLSGLCAYRKPLLIHFRERMDLIEKKGFGYFMGFEPMTHHRIKWNNVYKFEVFQPEFPNVDFCHGGNLTKKRWHKSQFIKKPKFWEESDVDHIPGWPKLSKLISSFYPQKI